ncbi:hypothetical protein ANN_03352 [Periplaneta americana]|uniref:RNA-directed DNA polymerase from mobile element jockey n=1 Tax=Periplaneta americana TaxID=6978 RepID=A0ABQ8TYS4_PERAM|nr:hypothetical protein ANN_03352 [Periplaneta americana]
MAGLCEGGNEPPVSLKASIRSQIGLDCSMLLYTSLVRSLLTYAAPVWGTANKTHMHRLQVLQNKFLRTATNAPWFRAGARVEGSGDAANEVARASSSWGMCCGVERRDGDRGREAAVMRLRLRGEIQRSFRKHHPLGI